MAEMVKAGHLRCSARESAWVRVPLHASVSSITAIHQIVNLETGVRLPIRLGFLQNASSWQILGKAKILLVFFYLVKKYFIWVLCGFPRRKLFFCYGAQSFPLRFFVTALLQLSEK